MRAAEQEVQGLRSSRMLRQADEELQVTGKSPGADVAGWNGGDPLAHHGQELHSRIVF